MYAARGALGLFRAALLDRWPTAMLADWPAREALVLVGQDGGPRSWRNAAGRTEPAARGSWKSRSVATGELGFVPLPPPSAEDMKGLTERIARKITAPVRRRLEEEGEEGMGRLEETVQSMESTLLRAMRVPGTDPRTLFEAWAARMEPRGFPRFADVGR